MRGAFLLALAALCACAGPRESQKPPPPAEAAPSNSAPAAPEVLLTPPQSLLPPKDILERLEKSPRHYLFEAAETMTPEEAAANANAFWPPRGGEGLPFPVVHTDAKGQRTLGAWAPSPAVEKYLEAAEPLFQAKDYTSAEQQYEAGLKEAPGDYLLLLNDGDAALFRGDAALALTRYEKATQANPWDHRSWYYRGNALAALDRNDEALQMYARALTLRPRHEPMLDGIRNRADQLGIALQTDVLLPRVSVTERPDGTIAIRAAAGAHWLAYGACKALWLGEPSHRKEVVGQEPHTFTTAEERECLANLVVVYAATVANGRAEAEPELDRLVEIARDGMLDAFILFELGSRISPHLMLLLPDNVRAQVEAYVQKYVLERRGRGGANTL